MMDFETWLMELDRVAREEFGYESDQRIFEDTGRDCWREPWLDGDTPRDAYMEGCRDD